MKKAEITLRAKENPEWKKQFRVTKEAIKKLNRTPPILVEEVKSKKKK
jgi:hypothetical protein